MTDNQGGEAATVDTTAAAEAALSSQDAGSERDYEAEAREQGWVPEAEFKGDRKPKKFLSAEEYVERGEFADKITKKVEAKYESRFKKLETVNAKTIEALQQQHAEKLANLQAQKRAAVKAGDVETVEKIDDRIEKHKDAAPETAVAETPAEQIAKKDAWTAKQPWWGVDEDMTEFAIGRSHLLLEKNPDQSVDDNLAAVEKALREKFPDKFGGKKLGANGHAPVDTGGSFPNAGAKADPLAKLPAEARQQAKNDMANFPTMYPDAASWLKAYNS